MLAVMVSMLLQSVHSYEHLAKQFSQKECIHQSDSKSQVTHEHHNNEHCFVCGFSLSSFVLPEMVTYKLPFVTNTVPYFFIKTTSPAFFSGSCYSLRGPPLVIV